jgi:hypothetical protein
MIREAIEYNLYSAIIFMHTRREKRDAGRHWLVKED